MHDNINLKENLNLELKRWNGICWSKLCLLSKNERENPDRAMIFDACFQLHTESRIASHRWHRKGAWAWKISFTSKRTENLINLDKHEFKTTLKRTESGWEFFTGCDMRLEWDGALADTNARWQSFMKLKRWKLNVLQLANAPQPQWSKLEMHFNSERCFFPLWWKINLLNWKLNWWKFLHESSQGAAYQCRQFRFRRFKRNNNLVRETPQISELWK